QAALFRLTDGSVRAIGNIDPFFGAGVLSRGLVGDRGGRLVVASPLKKQRFALDDGSCLDDPRASVPVYAARVTADGFVQVGRAAA
ncbi:MAG TPA: nitrite reductase small subunit NirD, partial [Mycobacterium sp.]|nr:nitrite reductase small subunit NirD [Mycobacterium sp.]